VETAVVDMQSATVAAHPSYVAPAPAPTAAAATATTATAAATATATATASATAATATAGATVTDTTAEEAQRKTATATTAKPEHLCAASGCGKAATSKCAGCGLAWYCSREHQTGHWKEQHKKVCKATDAVSVKGRRIARFLAEEPVANWQLFLGGVVFEMDEVARRSQSLLADQAIAEALIAFGVCETLVARCSSPWGDGLVGLLTFCCRLAFPSVYGAMRLVAASIFGLLAELFRVHIGDENAVRMGCYLMALLVDNEAEVEVYDQLMSAGVVEGVVAAVRAHPTLEGVVEVGVRVLADLARPSLPDVRRCLLNAGAVEVLKGALLSLPGDSWIRGRGKKALLRL
jgi:hypothetical protein